MKALKSWKTTLMGIIAALAILFPEMQAVIDNDPETLVDMAKVGAGLGMLGIGWFSRDNDKSSEDVDNK